MSPFRSDPEDDEAAIQTDRYLEALLAASTRRGAEPASDHGADADVRDAARRLRTGLLPLHPSFRFEERLGRRLDALARARHAGGRAEPEWAAIRPIREPTVTGPGGADPAAVGESQRAEPAAGRAEPDDAPGVTRPVLIGGAITSAALSLAGAVVVAWWRARPPRSAMARAIRAAHEPGARTRAGGITTPVGGPRGPA